MTYATSRTALLAAAIAAVALPALADDCAPVKAAFKTMTRQPYSLTAERTGKDGKPQTVHMVQTATTKYIEARGQWISMPISGEELARELDDRLAKGEMTCSQAGAEAVGGKSATIYKVHMKHDDNVSEGRVWISADAHMLKSDLSIAGAATSVVFDYDHVTPPANSTPLADMQRGAHPTPAHPAPAAPSPAKP